MKRVLRSASETKLFAARLANKVAKRRLYSHALVIGFVGDLGAGKTTFAQGFIKTFGVKHRIVSPTFLIFRVYPIPGRVRTSYKRIYHVDCYRIRKSVELDNMGFREILEDRENIVLVEWADKIQKILPKNAIWLKFHHGHKLNERVIKAK